jgi:AcrR family transcriptional regulator
MPRPRSILAHQKVLKAVLEMIAERGIENSSMDAIARASGVSKATIYKHWSSKEDLCLESIRCLQGEMPEFKSTAPRADVVKFLKHFAQMRKPETLGRIWPRIASYAASNPAFAKAWRAHMMDPRRAILTQLLERAVAKGELRPDLDSDLAMDLLIGPIMHRRFMNAAVPPDVPERVVDAFWKSHAAPPASI